jgi:hypothetical protein
MIMQDDDDNAISREVLYDPTTLPAIVAVECAAKQGAMDHHKAVDHHGAVRLVNRLTV